MTRPLLIGNLAGGQSEKKKKPKNKEKLTFEEKEIKLNLNELCLLSSLPDQLGVSFNDYCHSLCVFGGPKTTPTTIIMIIIIIVVRVL